jgi:hypothetical protein
MTWKPNCFPKVLLPNKITLGVRISMYKFGSSGTQAFLPEERVLD